jgi:hypothetical protein
MASTVHDTLVTIARVAILEHVIKIPWVDVPEERGAAGVSGRRRSIASTVVRARGVAVVEVDLIDIVTTSKNVHQSNPPHVLLEVEMVSHILRRAATGKHGAIAC